MNCLYGTVKEEIIWILIVCVTLCWGVPIPWSDSRSHNHHLSKFNFDFLNNVKCFSVTCSMMITY